MKRTGRLLVAAAVLLPLAGGRGVANSVTPPPNEPARALEVLVTVGPWPTLSALIGYRGRVWFANSVRYPDHNSADLYSLGLAVGDLRFERHLFTQDVGTPVAMDERHGISRLSGTHGVGHVRMATESRVDISHAHPFWAYPFTDVTVVHNGQLTNYHGMKREFESRGHVFQTENDSELIAVYLADKLAGGAELNSALEASLDDLDGTFTYLVSTRDGMGYAKDRWSAKPLVLMETGSVVAIDMS